MNAVAPQSDRVKNLPLVRAIEDVPEHVGILTGLTGKVRVREEDRQWMALLDIGSNRADLVWSNRREHLDELNTILGTARRDGITINQQFEITTDLLKVLYDAPGHSIKAADYKTKTAASFDEIIRDALKRHATDIHIRVREKAATILFRVHGELRPYKVITITDAHALAQAIYNVFTDAGTASNVFNKDDFLDASVTRTVSAPDDGRAMQMKIRFASKPTYLGYKITLRMLPMGEAARRPTLKALGYDDRQVRAMQRMVARPRGLILICGETSSGKSTTLVSLAQMYFKLNHETVNVVSIEDPPEYYMGDFADQIPVGGGGFAQALRATLRADPDAIMVGECRDVETAELMLQAVQTGHKCFSTLHTGSPFGAFGRFKRLGVDHEDLADDDIINGIVAQQLIPVVCPQCSLGIEQARQTIAHVDVIRRINALPRAREAIAKLRFRSDGKIDGKPCPTCGGDSIVDRTVVAEMFVTDALGRQYIEQRDIALLRAYWRSLQLTDHSGVAGRTMLDQAIDKMCQGLISPTDVESICGLLDDEETPEAAKRRYEDLLAARHERTARERAHLVPTAQSVRG